VNLRRELVLSLSVLTLALMGCGGGSSAQSPQSPTPPSPTPPPSFGGISISSLSPSSEPAGSPDLMLTMAGSNLDLRHAGTHQTNTVAVWSANGSDTTLPATVVSSTQLTAVVPAALLAKPVSAQLHVQKWYFADDTPFAESNSLSFSVVLPTNSGFSTTGSMAAARSGHSATLLSNGMVLVAGGADNLGVLASAEVYDATKGTFTATGNMITPRQGHTATLVADGKVLIAGGEDNVGPIQSAELYDPATGKFNSVGNMNNARWSHTATVLPNGKVLIAGGADNMDSQKSAELFDPANGAFTAIENMTSARMHHTATLLLSGKVLLAGGWSSYSPITTVASAELFDPETNMFTPVGPMNIPRNRHKSTLLPDGKVLISAGSEHQFSVSSLEVFDPASESFVGAGNLGAMRTSHTVTLLPDGKVLIVGGTYIYSGPDAPVSTVLDSFELYTPASQGSTLAGVLQTPRVGHTATLLNNGRVLVTGGTDSSGNALASAELYQ
jgi:Galactose oxidase, central domain